MKEIKVEHRPKEIRRIGERNDEVKEGKKIRPLRVTFSTEAVRDEVSHAYHKTRKATDKENKKCLCHSVNVRRYLTPLERKEEEDLFKEMVQKKQEANASGDCIAIWIRRRGKVVNIGKYPQQENPL